MYEMKPEYYTGIEEIDAEHAKLFEIANEAHEVLTNQFIPDKYDYIIKVVEDLRDYALYHFTNEEAYMEKVGYRRLLSQKIDHAEFMEKMNEFNPESIDENQKESLLELLDYVASWLVEHILKKDKLIGEI